MKTQANQPTAPTQAPIITHVINTPLVNVYLTAKGYEMHLTAKSGQIIEHEPFKGDLEGLVSALSLAAEINAGKFYLSRMLQPIAEQPSRPGPALIAAPIVQNNVDASFDVIDVQPTVTPAQPDQPAPTLKFSKPSTQPANGAGNGGTLNFRKGGA
jgi:hypothetical protein